ncbi:elongation factor 1-delta isoform X3 [Sturnira hondurensis]|uniref:elongation factor 1-delta isoform X3 n=2 Tax=Sturnira hondurensis TaxID=192404 RepID=UPI00187985D5|nr:elongation factor 1-delta isoform X3 [Sturnira hondurensis]
MRSGKASCALETVWEDKRKYGEAEQRFHEQEATRAATQQLLAQAPAVNGPGQEDMEEVDEAGAPDSCRDGPGKSCSGRQPLQKKRKRSPKSWLRGADLALVGLSADHVWLDKPLFDQAESSYRQRLANVAAQAARPPALAPRSPCSHGSQVACHHVTWGIWVNKSAFDQAERAFVEWSQALLWATEGSCSLGAADTGRRAPALDLALSHQPSPPANGQPRLGSLQALVREVWLEKPLYDAAERGFYEALFDGHPPGKVRVQERAFQAENPRRGRRDRRCRNNVGSRRAGLRRAEGEVLPSTLPHWYFLHRDAEAPWLSKPAYDGAEGRHHAAEAMRAAWRLEATSLACRPGARSGPSMSCLRPNRKMATDFLVHEKIWFDKFRYDDAERKFYEQMNGPVAGASCQENGASVILRDIARARENIQKSLAGSSGPGASSGPGGDHSELLLRIASLEVENQSLKGVVRDLQQAVSKLEARLSALEKSAPTHRATAPQTQHVSPMRQVEPPSKKAAPAAEDDTDDIDLFGSDEEEDKEAVRLREERLRQYAEKKAKKPALVAKSSILLDVKPWDDETDMAQLEACVRSIQLNGLTWGGSKLVPVGYGIRKLQIQCVVEDDKVGTDLLEEEITKFEEHVQSVDIAAFNKI